jgi:hypothetical protein
MTTGGEAHDSNTGNIGQPSFGIFVDHFHCGSNFSDGRGESVGVYRIREDEGVVTLRQELQRNILFFS